MYEEAQPSVCDLTVSPPCPCIFCRIGNYDHVNTAFVIMATVDQPAMSIEQLDFCEICMKAVPRANMQLHQLRCMYVTAPGCVAKIERSNSSDWFDYVENGPSSAKKSESSLNARNRRAKPFRDSLPIPAMDSTNHSVSSDCSDDWFDHVERTDKTTCPHCGDVFDNSPTCPVTNEEHMRDKPNWDENVVRR